MQELFADKTHFFKFLSMSDKQCLDQLKIITELLLISWYKLLLEVQGRGKYLINLSITLKYLISQLYLYSANFCALRSEMV